MENVFSIKKSDDQEIYVTLKRCQYLSPQYLQLIELRSELLRRPIGLTDIDIYDKSEIAACHLGLFLDGQAIGNLTLNILEGARAKLRQMAIRTQFQRLGMGCLLLREGERILSETGITTIELHARVTAIRFYATNGYEEIGETFQEVSIAHKLMRKQITSHL